MCKDKILACRNLLLPFVVVVVFGAKYAFSCDNIIFVTVSLLLRTKYPLIISCGNIFCPNALMPLFILGKDKFGKMLSRLKEFDFFFFFC